MIYLEKVVESDRFDFEKKLLDYSKRLLIKPEQLMVVLESESGLDPKAFNKMGGAVGINQIMPSTAKYLGTTCEDLLKMKASEQLDFVYKYFKPYAGKLKKAYQIYLVNFFPIAVGKPDDWVFETKSLKRSTIAKYNPAIDLNKDNQITIAEFKEWFIKRIGEDILKRIGDL